MVVKGRRVRVKGEVRVVFEVVGAIVTIVIAII